MLPTETKLDLQGVQNPELVIGLVGPLGTPMGKVVSLFQEELRSADYTGVAVRLSDFLEAYDLETRHPQDSDPAQIRWNALMDRGNQLRKQLGRGDALAMHAAAFIHQKRPELGDGPRSLEKKAFVLRQLKHPEEVQLLRQVYGEAFHLVGVYTPLKVRSEYLRNVEELCQEDAAELLRRDAGEEIKFGQQVTKTFHLSDLFLPLSGWDDESVEEARRQITRYLDLLFGRKIVTPTLEEYGMFLANSAALRSADLSRQVGAAILTQEGEVLGLGANEVPRAQGGQYWESDEYLDRDAERKCDSNEVIKLECLREVLAKLLPEWDSLSEEAQDERLAAAASDLSGTRLMNLTEFGRAVHAEMEAILSAARVGISVKGSLLFTTTFPCHNCAKHIIGAGIRQVYYVEPYAKSLADRLHRDAIALSLEDDDDSVRKVPFSSFHGVAPRRFESLFSSLSSDGTRDKRKVKGGQIRTEPVGLKTRISPLTHIEREALVARYLEEEMRAVIDLSEEAQHE